MPNRYEISHKFSWNHTRSEGEEKSLSMIGDLQDTQKGGQRVG